MGKSDLYAEVLVRIFEAKFVPEPGDIGWRTIRGRRVYLGKGGKPKFPFSMSRMDKQDRKSPSATKAKKRAGVNPRSWGEEHGFDVEKILGVNKVDTQHAKVLARKIAEYIDKELGGEGAKNTTLRMGNDHHWGDYGAVAYVANEGAPGWPDMIYESPAIERGVGRVYAEPINGWLVGIYVDESRPEIRDQSGIRRFEGKR